MILPALDFILDDGVVLLDLAARVEAEDLDISSLPRWRQLLGDLARLRSGWRPEPRILERAPRLDHWSVGEPQDFGLVRLLGTVTGHPLLPDHRVVTTSPLVALETQRGTWARTVSRFYVLHASQRERER
ncbi:DUF6634 family protein [Devosia sp. BK]|uniref:DUF6634 family protein n=1 Tax=Devosia sp. BK TaxID=2871706 RepID=UPI0039775556